jgi:hypothetical protein
VVGFWAFICCLVYIYLEERGFFGVVFEGCFFMVAIEQHLPFDWNINPGPIQIKDIQQPGLFHSY